MHRNGFRLTIAAVLALGLSLTAPQWVSGSTTVTPVETTDTGDTVDRTAVRSTSVTEPADLTDDGDTPPSPVTVPAAGSAPVAHATAAAPPAPPIETPAASTPIPEPTTTPATTPAPAPRMEGSATSATPTGAAAAVRTTGSIQVHVPVADGATRSVSIRSVDGNRFASPVTVVGSAIVFDDLDAGAYDLFAEELSDGGGTFMTRTTIEVSGGQTTVHCDAETLDCTVS